jgi:hypothetical protein
MPKFCTKCGSPLTENMQFCTSCGAQAAAQPAAAPAQTAPPVAAAAGGAVAAAPAAKKGSPLLKIILIVVAFFVVIGLLGAAAGVYVIYKAKQKVSGIVETAKTMSHNMGTPEVHLQKGGAGSEAAAAATRDVPPYPGAEPTEGGGDLSFGGMGGISGQEFVTEDPLDKVLAFYKGKFGSKINIQQSEGNAHFQLTTSKGMTTVTITRDEEAGKTKINIARIGK